MSALSFRTILKRILFTFAALALAALGWGAYGFYRVYYGKHVYETVPPELPSRLNQTAILVFSKTNGFRDDNAIKAANEALAAIAQRRGWSAVFTENGAVFHPAALARFNATVWNNTSGDLLTPDQRAAFRTYIESGGGFVGIHGAGGDPRYDWQWYPQTLIGAQFKGHPMNPQFQRATIRVEDPNDSAMLGLGATWTRVDEWYSFEQSPRNHGVHVLATLDEQTYNPRMLWKDVRMGADHPVIWKHCVGRGRAFYSALGHRAAAYQEIAYTSVLERAIEWAANPAGSGCPP